MKNIDLAMVQRRRFENYEREKDNLVVTKIEGGYSVANLNKASSYSVMKDSLGIVTCTCKDFHNFKGAIKCKHCIAVIRKAVRNKPSNMEPINGKSVINNIIKEEFNMNNQTNNNSINNNHIIPTQEDITTLQAILEKPFSLEQIKYRKGFNGKQLSYIETHSAIERLNQAFKLKWSWEILDYKVEEKQVYCRGKLSVKIDGDTGVALTF